MGVVPRVEVVRTACEFLVGEDEYLVEMFVSDILTGAEYEVIGPAKTAAEGLDLTQTSRPDLALINIDLPGETKETHLALSLRSRFGTPVFFVSGNKGEAWEARDAALGYIAKPCKPSTLVKY